jgi:predicted Zn-dependent peptidase
MTIANCASENLYIVNSFMLYSHLPNGLTAILKQDINLKNAVVNIFINKGSASESKKVTGLAHFLEHMMFEGSANYPNFDEALQVLMAENNAFTSQDYTNYYEVMPCSYIDQILKIEADRLENLSLKLRKFKLQQSIILEEFKETSINPPLSDSWHHLLNMCFKDAYQWPVIGKKLKHISELKLRDVEDFYTKNYSSENLTISIISNQSEENMLKMIENNFGKLNFKRPITEKRDPKSKLMGGFKILKRRNISSSQIFIAFHIADFGHKEYFVADLVSDLLTNGDSSILYRALIIDKHLCTEILSYTTDNRCSNLLIIEAKVSPNIDYQKVIDEILAQIDRLKNKGIPKSKFETVKNKALTHWMFQLYNTTQLAHFLCLFKSCEIEYPVHFIENLYFCLNRKEFCQSIKTHLNFQKSNILVYTVA